MPLRTEILRFALYAAAGPSTLVPTAEIAQDIGILRIAFLFRHILFGDANEPCGSIFLHRRAFAERFFRRISDVKTFFDSYPAFRMISKHFWQKSVYFFNILCYNLLADIGVLCHAAKFQPGFKEQDADKKYERGHL